jgi:hypothetical protein
MRMVQRKTQEIICRAGVRQQKTQEAGASWVFA